MLTECCPSHPQFSAAQHSLCPAVAAQPYSYFENVDEETWSLVIIMCVFMIQVHRNPRYECPDLCFPGWFHPIKKKKRKARRMRKKEEKDKEGEKGKRKMERRRNHAIIQNI